MSSNKSPTKGDVSPEDVPNSKQSPIMYSRIEKNRSCTDVICLLLLILFTIGQIVLIGFTVSLGNFERVFRSTDSQGNLCEKNQQLLIYDVVKCAEMNAITLQHGCPSPKACVDKCPEENWSWKPLSDEETSSGKTLEKRRTDELICLPNVKKEEGSVQKLVEDDKCASYYFKSKPFLNFCMPSIFTNESGTAKDSEGKPLYNKDGTEIPMEKIKTGMKNIMVFLRIYEWFNSAINGLDKSWPVIVGLILAGAALSLIWCLLLRFFTKPIVYFTIFIFIFFFIGGTLFCYFQWYFVAEESSAGQLVISQDVNTYLNLKEFWLTLAIIGTIISVILLIVMLFLRKRISLAVNIICHASKAIGSMLSSLFFPAVTFVFESIVLIVWILITLMISSIGEDMYSNDKSESCSKEKALDFSAHCFQSYFRVYPWSYALHAYNTFTSFWLLTFFYGVNQIILAGAFASWYWTFDKSALPYFPLLSSIKRSCRYHLGTVAFGSLLIAIVMFLRAVLTFIQDRVSKFTRDNACVKFIFCCCHCCLWCLEKFLRFLSKNAFIMTAMSGFSFCKAAKEAFFLILRNCLRLFVVDRITSFVLLLGKVTIIVGLGVASYYAFKDSTEVFYVPVIVVVMGCLIVSQLFFSVFSMSVDTIFLCVMDDLERNDGSPDKPYFMSKDLMKALTKKNVIQKSKPSDMQNQAV